MTISQHELLAGVWDADPVIVAYTGTAARSTLLPVGVHVINATTALHFKQGGVAVDATANSNYLPAGAVVAIEVQSAASGYVSFIRHADSGSAYIMTPRSSDD